MTLIFKSLQSVFMQTLAEAFAAARDPRGWWKNPPRPPPKAGNIVSVFHFTAHRDGREMAKLHKIKVSSSGGVDFKSRLQIFGSFARSVRSLSRSLSEKAKFAE
jgi:hypothetical protein